MDNPYRLLGSRRMYRDEYFEVIKDRILKPGDIESDFAYINMKAGSTVLPFTEKNEVFLVQEWKYAIQRPSLEAISGGIDKGESPLEAAKRELREEGGLEASEWIDLGAIDPFTTLVNSPNYLFLAFGLSNVEAKPDEGEVLEIVKLPFAEALQGVLNNKIRHAGSSVVILRASEWLQRNNRMRETTFSTS